MEILEVLVHTNETTLVNPWMIRILSNIANFDRTFPFDVLRLVVTVSTNLMDLPVERTDRFTLNIIPSLVDMIA